MQALVPAPASTPPLASTTELRTFVARNRERSRRVGGGAARARERDRGRVQLLDLRPTRGGRARRPRRREPPAAPRPARQPPDPDPGGRRGRQVAAGGVAALDRGRHPLPRRLLQRRHERLPAAAERELHARPTSRTRSRARPSSASSPSTTRWRRSVGRRIVVSERDLSRRALRGVPRQRSAPRSPARTAQGSSAQSAAATARRAGAEAADHPEADPVRAEATRRDGRLRASVTTGWNRWRLVKPQVIVEHYTARTASARPTTPSPTTRPTASCASSPASARTS